MLLISYKNYSAFLIVNSFLIISPCNITYLHVIVNNKYATWCMITVLDIDEFLVVTGWYNKGGWLRGLHWKSGCEHAKRYFQHQLHKDEHFFIKQLSEDWANSISCHLCTELQTSENVFKYLDLWRKNINDEPYFTICFFKQSKRCIIFEIWTLMKLLGIQAEWSEWWKL